MYSIKPAFKDKRGSIADILEGEVVKHIGIITFSKGAVRGNHYHKISTQYTYVLDGKIKFETRSTSKGSKVQSKILKAGDFASIPQGVIHTYTALTKASLLDFTTLARTDNGYEKDTIRIGDIAKPKLQ